MKLCYLLSKDYMCCVLSYPICKLRRYHLTDLLLIVQQPPSRKRRTFLQRQLWLENIWPSIYITFSFPILTFTHTHTHTGVKIFTYMYTHTHTSLKFHSAFIYVSIIIIRTFMLTDLKVYTNHRYRSELSNTRAHKKKS